MVNKQTDLHYTKQRGEIIFYSLFVIIFYLIYFRLVDGALGDNIIVNDLVHSICKLITFCLPLLVFGSKFKERALLTRSIIKTVILFGIGIVVLGYILYFCNVSASTLLGNTPLFLIINSFLEETTYRGIFLSKSSNQNLSRQNLIQSICFALIHLPFYIATHGFNLLLIPNLLGVGLLGYILGLIKIKTNNLTRPIIIHTLYNIIVIFILPSIR